MTVTRRPPQRAVIDPALLVRIARRHRHAGLRLRRGHHPPGLSGPRPGARGPSARHPLRAEGQLVAAPSCACCAGSARGRRQFRRRDRGRAARRPDPRQIVFTGVGKTREELERAVTLGVKPINAESAGELDRIAAIARRPGAAARVALRVNPDIDAKSHPHISTGLKTNKFGMPLERGARDLSRARAPGGARARRRARPRRIADHHASIRSARAAEARRLAGPLAARRRHRRSSTWISAAASGSAYDGPPVPTPEDYAVGGVPVLAPTGLAAAGRARPRAGGPLPACC